MINRRVFAVPAGVVAIALTAGTAQAAVIVGSPSQSNTQNASTQQGIVQNSGGGITIGDTGQSAANASTSTLANDQEVDSGLFGTIVGSPAQSNAQNASTQQAAAQQAGGGIVVGDTAQSAANSSATALDNFQGVGGFLGSIIVGSPAQSNAQNAATGQACGQAAGGGVVIGTTGQSCGNSGTTIITSSQFIPEPLIK